MASSYYFVINEAMLDLTDNNKYLYWTTGGIVETIVYGNISDRELYHNLVGCSDIVIECLDNNPPRYVKNITRSKSPIDTEQFTYIKLSSINLKDML